MKITPVLMVGGAGSRLWPMSTSAQPKQFQSLLTTRTMFQETILRVSGTVGGIDFEPPVIIGATAYADLIATQLAEIDVVPSAIILEPSPQNTAAVAAIAAATVGQLGGGLALLLPSDSHIGDTAAFQMAIEQAAPSANKDWIVTFGIAPDRPETGYGYIKAGRPLDGHCSAVDAFVEKPDLEKAKTYLTAGGYTWNAGLFLFAPQTMLSEMKKLAPGILANALEAKDKAEIKDGVTRLNPEAFSKCDKRSIDYAVMEKTDKAAVVGPVACGWSDVGSWNALKDISTEKHQGNIVSIDTEDCYIRADDGTLITTIGVSGLVIVAHQGSILIMPQDRSQDVKKIVETLKSGNQKDRL